MQDLRLGSRPGGSEVHKQDLSVPRRKLVELMREVRYGRIKVLRVARGEPVLDPPPEVIRLIVLGRKEAQNRPGPWGDGALKDQIVDLFQVLDREQDVLIRDLVIDNGLPIRMDIVHVNRAA